MALKHIGHEFYGAGAETSFPKLKELKLLGMTEWEDWEIPFSNFKKVVMPRLIKLEVTNFPKLMGLPALGRLESLETIKLAGLHKVKTVGAEFFGISSNENENEKHQQEQPLFPRLKKLTFSYTAEWEALDFPIMLYQQKVPKIEIMPPLSELSWCHKLKKVPLAGLGKLQSLEGLELEYLHSGKLLGADLFGISGENAVAETENGESADVMLFPTVKKLSVGYMPEWEEDEDKEIMEARGTSTVATTAFITPRPKELEISSLIKLKLVQICGFAKLKVMPHHMLSHTLRKLYIINFPALTGSQPCLPPLLEDLVLNGDVGVLSKSLIPITAKDNNYPNLKSFKILFSPHSSLPEGLNKFTSLQFLDIHSCKYLDLNPEEELRHFPMLQKLVISESPILSERCIRDDWKNTLSHQISYNIIIDLFHQLSHQKIIGTKRH